MSKRQVFGRNSLLDPGRLIINATEPNREPGNHMMQRSTIFFAWRKLMH